MFSPNCSVEDLGMQPARCNSTSDFPHRLRPLSTPSTLSSGNSQKKKKKKNFVFRSAAVAWSGRRCGSSPTMCAVPAGVQRRAAATTACTVRRGADVYCVPTSSTRRRLPMVLLAARPPASVMFPCPNIYVALVPSKVPSCYRVTHTYGFTLLRRQIEFESITVIYGYASRRLWIWFWEIQGRLGRFLHH